MDGYMTFNYYSLLINISEPILQKYKRALFGQDHSGISRDPGMLGLSQAYIENTMHRNSAPLRAGLVTEPYLICITKTIRHFIFQKFLTTN